MRTTEQDERVRGRLEARREIDAHSGCWNYAGCVTGNGYGHMSFYGKAEYTHRVAAIVYLDFDPAESKVVMHRCDNQRCFNPSHLSIGTQKQNMSDAARRGRMGGKKLTAEDAAAIKWRLTRGATQRQLATEYGVSTTAIGQISRNQTWRNVTPRQPTDADRERARRTQTTLTSK